jgi:2-oxoglutarate dehydrogenase E1 component
MGAARFILPHLKKVVGRDVHYAGREEAASPAAGSKAIHYREFKAFLKNAFSL